MPWDVDHMWLLYCVWLCRPATGYLGDAPSWTFHGPQQRNLLAMSQAGCPMSPTAATGPGPGAYNTETSAFGAQVQSSQPSLAVVV